MAIQNRTEQSSTRRGNGVRLILFKERRRGRRRLSSLGQNKHMTDDSREGGGNDTRKQKGKQTFRG